MKYNFTHNYTIGGSDYSSKGERMAFGFLWGVLALFIIAMVVLVGWAVGSSIKEATTYDTWYEYTDFDGNVGEANRCYTDKGSLLCQIWPEEEGNGLHINRNSEYIVVKSYRRVKTPKNS